MRLRLPAKRVAVLRSALKRAGAREIGGQIFAEQLAPSDFRATHLTVQRERGRFASFVVDVVQAARDATRFFRLTKHDYGRFNYLGEWHSHHAFAVWPSPKDTATMVSIVDDPGFAGSFVVLMIVRLDGDSLEKGAWLFAAGGERVDVMLELE